MNKKKLIILISIIIILAILVCVGVFAMSGSKKAKIADKLDLGEKYLEELKYEKALAAYKEVLKIDPKNVDAYLGLAEVYIAMGEYEEALEILEEGYDETESRKIEKKAEEVKTLVSEGENDTWDGEKMPASLYFICIDGVQFNLPFKLSELEKVGFDLTECKGTQIGSGESTHFWLKRNDLSYSFHIWNQNETTSDVLDCVVSGMALSSSDCSKAEIKTIGDIEVGSGEELVKTISEQYEGSVTETEDGRHIYYFAENESGQYRIDVGPEGFANYFEVYNKEVSKLYSVDKVGRFLEYNPDGGEEINKEPEEEQIDVSKPTDEPIATPEPFAIPDSDDFVIDWKDSTLETMIRDTIGVYGRDITYGDVKNVTQLYLGSEWDTSRIKDISALSYFTNLEYLWLNYSEVTDINALRNLSKLTTLSLFGNFISDISALNSLTNLENLDLTWNNISDISPIGNLTKLTSLNLCGRDISDLSVLSGLTNLRHLTIYDVSLSDISVLSNLSNLETLYLSDSSLNDISALRDLTSLEDLSLLQCSISDISALADLTNLSRLYLSGNQISDISALSGLSNLTELTLASNQISDISALSNLIALEILDLENNQISDISALSGLMNLQYLLLPENVTDYSPVSHVPEVH